MSYLRSNHFITKRGEITFEQTLRPVALPSLSVHIPANSAAQLLSADFFAASAPGEVVLVLAGTHYDIKERIVVAVWRVGV